MLFLVCADTCIHFRDANAHVYYPRLKRCIWQRVERMAITISERMHNARQIALEHILIDFSLSSLLNLRFFRSKWSNVNGVADCLMVSQQRCVRCLSRRHCEGRFLLKWLYPPTMTVGRHIWCSISYEWDRQILSQTLGVCGWSQSNPFPLFYIDDNIVQDPYKYSRNTVNIGDYWSQSNGLSSTHGNSSCMSDCSIKIIHRHVYI